jgi:hypothetical protein
MKTPKVWFGSVLLSRILSDLHPPSTYPFQIHFPFRFTVPSNNLPPDWLLAAISVFDSFFTLQNQAHCVQLFSQNYFLTISRSDQASISNDYSLSFKTCWGKVCVSTLYPFTDSRLNHFNSKNSNHPSIVIEICIFTFIVANGNIFRLILYAIISTFKAYRYLHSFEFHITTVSLQILSLAWIYPETVTLRHPWRFRN